MVTFALPGVQRAPGLPTSILPCVAHHLHLRCGIKQAASGARFFALLGSRVRVTPPVTCDSGLSVRSSSWDFPEVAGALGAGRHAR